MVLTSTVKKALEDDGAFICLLSEYGKWSCFNGGVGYINKNNTPLKYDIDDDSALCVDKAMCRLKANQPNLYKLIEYWYIRGLDEGDIISLVKSEERAPFKIDKKTRKFFKYLTVAELRSLLYKAETLVRGYLSEGE